MGNVRSSGSIFHSKLFTEHDMARVLLYLEDISGLFDLVTKIENKVNAVEATKKVRREFTITWTYTSK